MSIFTVSHKIPEDYILTIINSTLISYYVDNFVNNTQTFQINDARQLPIVIPNQDQISKSFSYVLEALKAKKEFNNDELKKIQSIVDSFVEDIYKL